MRFYKTEENWLERMKQALKNPFLEEKIKV